MDIKNNLIEKFGAVISKAFIEKEASNTFLRVELDEKNLDTIIKISKEISIYLDEIDYLEDDYFLDVYSSGTEKSIEIENAKDHIEDNVLVSVNEVIKGQKSFEGTLLEVDQDSLLIRWNAKGQFRKQKIEFKNIEELRLSSKIRKDK